MSGKQDFSDIGEKIRSTVQGAIESGDFSRLNDIVNDTIEGAVDEVRRQVGQMQERFVRPDGPCNFGAHPEPGRRKLPEVYMSKTGSVSGILFTVFGGIGLGIFGILAFVMLICWALTWESRALLMLFLFAVPAAGFGGMLGKGCSLRTRLKCAKRYLKLMGDQRYIEIEELAVHTGQSVKKVRRDIRRILDAGIIPEGHMDEEETILLPDDETWKKYLSVRREWEAQQKEEEDKKNQPDEQGEEMLSPEEQIEREGREYMDRLRRLNVEIPGEVISNKLYKLDYLLQRIFMALQGHPEKCPQMHKFMDYYLPTTVKLVEAYADFDKAGVRGEHIMNARAEIEKTMDTINQAFEKLLDDMYQDAAFEAAADAKVLKTILAQDGYMKSEFSENGEKGTSK